MQRHIIKSQKDITGVEFPVGAEWDAGCLPFGSVHRKVRVSVRKDDEQTFTVFAVGFKGGQTLACVTAKSFPCETCAKAVALDIVNGFGYAECATHLRFGFTYEDLHNGFVAALRALLGIDDDKWSQLHDGAKHHIVWVAQRLLDGQLDWIKVLRAWEATEVQKFPLAGAVSYFVSELK